MTNLCLSEDFGISLCMIAFCIGMTAIGVRIVLIFLNVSISISQIVMGPLLAAFGAFGIAGIVIGLYSSFRGDC